MIVAEGNKLGLIRRKNRGRLSADDGRIFSNSPVTLFKIMAHATVGAAE